MKQGSDEGVAISSQAKAVSKPYLFEPMLEQPNAIERLDIQFRWGGYGIRVVKFHHIMFGAGKIVPFHKHSEYEFHYIPRGKGKLVLANGSYPLHEGLLYVTGPGVVHQQESDRQDPMSELCLHVDIVKLEPGLPGQALTEGGEQWGAEWEAADAESCVLQLNRLPTRPVMDSYRAMECFLGAYRAWQDNRFGLYTLLKQSICDILLRTIQAYADIPQPDLPSRDMKQHRYKLAVQFMKDNSGSALTLESVAERVQISPRQLQRIFREQSGSTFSSYLEHVRIGRVCEQLVRSDATVEAIAMEQGFSSANYMHYVFKRKLGITPLRYREKLRQP
jgi:AraC-like DNA-binding protein/mannose-6-phosphate isomerase-like protein (cupin superfamily)